MLHLGRGAQCTPNWTTREEGRRGPGGQMVTVDGNLGEDPEFAGRCAHRFLHGTPLLIGVAHSG